MRHEVYDVGVAFDVQDLGHVDGAGLGDSTYVVAPEVEQHDVLCPLLLVVAQLFFERDVLGLGPAPSSGTGDGMNGDLAIDDLNEQLRRCADDLKAVQVEIVHVGRGVDRAESAIDLERVGGSLARHALGDDGLDNVAGDYVLAGLLDHLLVVLASHVELDVGVGLALEIGVGKLWLPLSLATMLSMRAQASSYARLTSP